MTELEELSLELLRIESPIGAEGAIADHVEAWLAGVGVHQLVRAGDNVACLPHAFREGHARVLLLGHLDTVPASDANPPRIEGERIHGLGATDMKCADAILLDLARRAAREAPRHDLAIVLYAREEGPYSESGMLEIVPAASACFEGIDLAIAMEPTDNRAELGCLGTLHARVRFQGKRAHSGRPWQGENALHMAGPLLVALGQLAPRVVDYDGLRFRETASATMVDYDGARNVVPETCTLNVNFRYGPDRSPDEAERWIRDFVTAHVDPDLTARGLVTVEIPDLCPAGRVCHTNPLLAELRDEATRTGQPLEIAAKEAWTDVGRLSHMGIDGLNLGPGATDQAHKRGEWCDRAALERAHALLSSWLWPQP